MAEHDASLSGQRMPEDLAALREMLVGPERAQLADVARRLDEVQQQLGNLPEILRPEISALVTECLREAIASTPELDSVRLNERAGRALKRARRIAATASVTTILIIAGAFVMLSGRNSQAVDQQQVAQQAKQDAARLQQALDEAKKAAEQHAGGLEAQVRWLQQQLDQAKQTDKDAKHALAVAQEGRQKAEKDLLDLQQQLRGTQWGTETAEQRAARLTVVLQQAAKGREEMLAKLDAAEKQAKQAQDEVDTLTTRSQDATRQVGVLEERAAQLEAELRKARLTPGRTRYALATNYGAALAFLHQQFNEVTTAPTAEGSALMGTRLAGSSALTVRVDKEKVLWAELTLSLSADMPPTALTDNKNLLHAFAELFAPTWKDPDAWLLDAAQRAGTLGTQEKLVRAADAFKVTVGQDKMGATVVRIEPLQNDVEDE